MPRKMVIPNFDNLIKRYVAGESVNKLAREIGVDRNVIKNRLIENGITPRNQSESEAIKWAFMPAEKRIAQLAAAHTASKGRKRTVEQKIYHAKCIEKHPVSISAAEISLSSWLLANGYEIIQQKAIHIYNVDIAIEKFGIAIEIFGGNFHATGHHRNVFHERTKYLIDHGWNMIFVWVDGRRHPLGINGCERVHSIIQETSLNPSSGGKYWMILGDGNDAPAVKTYLNSIAVV